MPQCGSDLRWTSYKFPGASLSLHKIGKEGSSSLKAVLLKRIAQAEFWKLKKKKMWLLPAHSHSYIHIQGSMGKAPTFSKTQAKVKVVISLPFIKVCCGDAEPLHAYFFSSLMITVRVWMHGMTRNIKNKTKCSWEVCFRNWSKGGL